MGLALSGVTYDGPQGWALPFAPGSDGSLPGVVQGYGPTGKPLDGSGPNVWESVHDTGDTLGSFVGHDGIDYAIAQGTPLYAMRAGTVHIDRSWTLPGHPVGWALRLMTQPGGTIGAPTQVLYGHVSQFAVADGTNVNAGDLIGYSGGAPGTPGAGFSTGPHLHLEFRNAANQSVNPHSLMVAIASGAKVHDLTQVASDAAGAAKTAVVDTAGAIGNVAGALTNGGRWVRDHLWTIGLLGASSVLVVTGLGMYKSSGASLAPVLEKAAIA